MFDFLKPKPAPQPEPEPQPQLPTPFISDTGVVIHVENAALIEFYEVEKSGTYDLRIDGLRIAKNAAKSIVDELKKRTEESDWQELYSNVLINPKEISLVRYLPVSEKLEVHYRSYVWDTKDRALSTYQNYLKYYGSEKTYTPPSEEELQKIKEEKKNVKEEKSKAKATQGGSAAEFNISASVGTGKLTMEDMIGCESAKNEIRGNLALAQLEKAKREMNIPCEPISRHMAFLGNPGTGKTTFARFIAEMYHKAGIIRENKLFELTREHLVGEFIGQTEKIVMKVLDQARGGVLFIDEVYSLGSGEDKGSRDFGKHVTDALVSALENMRDDLIVIVAGYKDTTLDFLDSNPGLRSRFPNLVHFEDYTVEEMQKIMELMLKKQGLSISDEAHAEAMKALRDKKENTPTEVFGNAREVRTLVGAAKKALAKRLVKEDRMLRVGDEDVKEKLTLQLSDILEANKPAPKREATRKTIGGFGPRPQAS